MKKTLALVTMVVFIISMLTVGSLSSLASADTPLVDPTMSNLVAHTGWVEYTTWVAWSSDPAAVVPSHETVSGVPSGTTTAVKWTGNANRSIIWTVLTGDKQPAAGDYIFSASVKLNGVENEGSDLRGFAMWAYDNPNAFLDGGAELAKTSFLSGTADWQTVSLPVTVANNKIALAFELMSAPGTVYITDVKLEPASTGDDGNAGDDDNTGDGGNAGDGEGGNTDDGVQGYIANPTFTENVVDVDWSQMQAKWVKYTNHEPATRFTTETVSVSGLESGTTTGIKLTSTDAKDKACFIWQDVFGNHLPAAGKYILSLSAKYENIECYNNEDALQGFGVRVIEYKAGDTTGNATGNKLELPQYYKGTSNGWVTITMPITISDKAFQIAPTLMNCTGSVIITDVKLVSKDGAGGSNEGEDEDTPVGIIPDPTFAHGVESHLAWTEYTNWVCWRSELDNSTFAVVNLAEKDRPASGTATALQMSKTGYGRTLTWIDLLGDQAVAAGNYKISAMVKLDNVMRVNESNTGDGFGFCIRTPDSLPIEASTSFTELRYTASARDEGMYFGTEDWQEISLEFTVPEGCENIQVGLDFMSATGTVYVTDVQIKKMSPGLVIADAGFAEGTDLVANNATSGAELDGLRYQWSGLMDGETDQAFEDAFAIVTDEVPDGGDGALRITAKSGVTYRMRQIIEKLEAGTDYVVHLKAKTVGLTGDGASLSLTYLDAEGNLLTTESEKLVTPKATGDQDWTDMWVVFTASENAADLLISLNVENSNGTVYFSNAVIESALFYEIPTEGFGNVMAEEDDDDDDGYYDDLFGDNDDEVTENEPVESPNTGYKLPMLSILLLMISAGVLLTLVKKQTV